MMMDVLCEEADRVDEGEGLAGDVDTGNDDVRIGDPGGEVARGAEECVAADWIGDVGGVNVLGAGGLVSRVSPF